MKGAVLSFALLMLGCAPVARANLLLYDNTTTDTLATVLYSLGPYAALGDQIHLVSAGTANQAKVQMFNNGGAGTFNAELDFFNAGSPLGSPLGSFNLAGISSLGLDVIDLTFGLGGGLMLPQDLVFTVSVSNLSPNMDLGLNMFEPPTAGTSDNSFMIVATGGPTFFQLGTDNENVYFQLSGTSGVSAVPEVSTLTLLGTGLLVMGIGARAGRRRTGEIATKQAARTS